MKHATQCRTVLGINAAYHESAAALIVDDTVVFAVEEERLSRVKHAKRALVSNPHELPWRAIQACLNAAGLDSLLDCDAIGYSLVPHRRKATIGTDPYAIERALGFGTMTGENEFDRCVQLVPKLLADFAKVSEITEQFHYIAHHRAHAASAFLSSPFPHAALLVVDGIAEDSTAWLGQGSSEGIVAIEEIPYPHSIGLLWERIAVYLGFTEYDACKVMGLAAYGDPDRFDTQFDRLFSVNGQQGHSHRTGTLPFSIEPALARLRSGDVQGMETLFGPRQLPGEPLEGSRFADVAAGLQKRTEEAVSGLCWRLARATGEKRLAYAGGVALNCISNARIEREGPFEEIDIIGAAHDAGTAIGAAAEAAGDSFWRQRRNDGRRMSAFLGPDFSEDAIDHALWTHGWGSECVADRVEQAASMLVDGLIVGWFQGRLEFGPRALGGRSLLADPRDPGLRERLNRRIKHRETFRPFGASILVERAADWFELPDRRVGGFHSRYRMLLAYTVHSDKRHRIPAVVHHDGTCRIQVVDKETQPLFHRLLSRFNELTGVPILLNTSFNDQEPLVASPEDALRTFARTGIDCLLLENRLIRRQQCPSPHPHRESASWMPS